VILKRGRFSKQEREEREEIEKELRVQEQQAAAVAAAAASMFRGEAAGNRSGSGGGGGGGGDSDNNNDPPSSTASSLAAAAAAAASMAASMASAKEPPPLGLAGLEAFRREYLTSPLSHLRGMGSLGAAGVNPLLPPFPPLLPPLSGSPGGGLPDAGGFARSNTNRSSLSGGGTPPSERERERGGGGGHGSAHSTPSSEFSSQQNWSFEEQFKQLYELSDCPKRKEFLDDLFAFMQKRGTPINRLPIMAKQVLDLYELYNLVTSRGGLVEVINKKQWQEIIKGLNLPSSITSAAFTLRTQYTKYVYPYECHMKNLSSPSELQQAIDGNRREGRRAGYESYNMFPGIPGAGVPPRPQVPLPPTSMPGLPQISPLPPGVRPPPFNGNFPGNMTSHGKRSPNPTNPLSALEMTRLALFKMYNQAGGGGGGGLPGGPPHPPPGLSAALAGQAGCLEMAGRAMAEQHARALQAVREAEAEKKAAAVVADQEEAAAAAAASHQRQREKELLRAAAAAEEESRRRRAMAAVPGRHRQLSGDGDDVNIGSPEEGREGRERGDDDDEDEDLSPPPMKRERHYSRGGADQETKHNGQPSPPLGGANIRIANRGEAGDSSLVVSLEINSVMYQGVLFAQPAAAAAAGKTPAPPASATSGSGSTAAATTTAATTAGGGVNRESARRENRIS